MRILAGFPMGFNPNAQNTIPTSHITRVLAPHLTALLILAAIIYHSLCFPWILTDLGATESLSAPTWMQQTPAHYAARAGSLHPAHKLRSASIGRHYKSLLLAKMSSIETNFHQSSCTQIIVLPALPCQQFHENATISTALPVAVYCSCQPCSCCFQQTYSDSF